MTTLVITVIAILLFGIVITAAIMYVDTDEISAVGMAPAAASSLVNIVEASSSFKNERGYYPVSITDLKSEFDIEPRGFRTSDFVISDGVACLSMPYETDSDKLLTLASAKIKGSVVTDTCGSSGITGRRFLALSMDGVNLPMASNMITGPAPTPTPTPAPGFSQPNNCSTVPDATASVASRGAWLACYAAQIKPAAQYWIYAGRGLTPSPSQLYNAGYIHYLPPVYPELSSIYLEYVAVSGVNSTRIRMDLNKMSGAAGVQAGSDLAVAIANASSGFMVNSGGAYWKALSQPIYNANEYAAKVYKAPIWVGPIPIESSSLDDKAAYTAYRLRVIWEAAKDAAANGTPYSMNAFTEAKLTALGYVIPPKGSWTQTDTIYYRNSTYTFGLGTPGTVGPNYYTAYNYLQPWTTTMCSRAVDFSYGFLKCDNYSTNWYNATPRVPQP